MACKNVAPHAVRWLAASTLLVAACAGGDPPGSLTFGFGTTDDMPPDSVGTFVDTTAGDDVQPTAGMEDTLGATSMPPATDGPTSGEPPVTCGNGLIDDGEECDGPSLGDAECETQGFDAGSLSCADDCTFDTSECITFACGNEIIEGAEVCDGAALDGQTCVSQGFDAGTLGCAANCGAYDTSGCIACGNGVIEGTEVCDGAALGGQTCITQGFDGGNLACAANCAAFNTGGCTLAPPPLPVCVDQDLLSAVGSPVANGTTVGQNEAMPQSCGASGAVDFVLRFIAPAAATYQFNTNGSTYDTVLSLHDTCGGAAVVCDDDAGDGLQSLLSLPMVAGQQILIAVSGYAGSTGSWTLNIIQM